MSIIGNVLIGIVVWVMQLFIALFCMIMFFCIDLIALALLYYLFSTDLDGWLNEHISDSSFLHKVRERTLNKVKHLDDEYIKKDIHNQTASTREGEK